MVSHCNEMYECKECHSGWTGTIALQGANTMSNEKGEGNYVPKWRAKDKVPYQASHILCPMATSLEQST